MIEDPLRASTRGGRLLCRACSALPESSDAVGRGQCPWCRNPLSLEFGPVVARCAECHESGIVGQTLVTRVYTGGRVDVPRAVCVLHARAGGTGSPASS